MNVVPRELLDVDMTVWGNSNDGWAPQWLSEYYSRSNRVLPISEPAIGGDLVGAHLQAEEPLERAAHHAKRVMMYHSPEDLQLMGRYLQQADMTIGGSPTTAGRTVRQALRHMDPTSAVDAYMLNSMTLDGAAATYPKAYGAAARAAGAEADTFRLISPKALCAVVGVAVLCLGYSWWKRSRDGD